MLAICYASSNEYAPYTGVSMLSLLQNNASIISKIYILSFGINDENIMKIKQVADLFKCEVQIIDAITEMRATFERLGMRTFEGSYATYARAFISEVIKDYDGKLLYIDSDTVIDGSLGPLLSIDMEKKGYSFGAVLGMNQYRYPYQEQCIYKGKKVYYACGVLLFHLGNWKKNKCNKLIVDYIMNSVDKDFVYADQTVINNALPEQYGVPLDLKFNYWGHMYRGRRIIYELTRKNFYTKTQVKEAMEAPVIIHYKGHVVHPWLKGNASSLAGRYAFYCDMSPWREQDNKSIYYDEVLKKNTEQQKKLMDESKKELMHGPFTTFLIEKKVFVKHLIFRRGK